jgi:hypothetical protein
VKEETLTSAEEVEGMVKFAVGTVLVPKLHLPMECHPVQGLLPVTKPEDVVEPIVGK